VDAQSLRTDQGDKMQEKETLDERLPALFEPDTLLPVQYFEAMRRKHLLEGEKRLILSVLEDAIECFMKCIDASTNKGQRLFREADEWINHEDKRWVFSFDNVCDMLDINPEYMRSGMKRWKENKLAAIERRRAALAEEAARAREAAVAIASEPAPVVVISPAATIVAAKPAVKLAASAASHHQRHQERAHQARPAAAQKLRKHG
jgi:hypothetical protein